MVDVHPNWPNPRIPFQLASERAMLPALDGKRLLVHVVMNVEWWPFELRMPRGLVTAPHGKPLDPPDLGNYSWVEYGLRCGMPRFLAAMRERGIAGTCFLNARVADVYPALADAIVAHDFELVGHGEYQRSVKEIEDEEEMVRWCLERLEALSGKRVRGWFGPGFAETLDSPDIFKRLGLDFTHDWLVDDLPVWIKTSGGPLLGLPYTLELNDVPIWAIHGLSSDELLKRVEATLAVFDKEMAHQVRIMTFGLHPHLISVAHRHHHFERILDLLLARPDTTFVTSSVMADWFTAAEPAPAAFPA